MLYLVAGILVQEINSTLKITWLTVGISAIMLYKVYGDVIQQVDGLTELINRLGYENYLSRFQGKGAILPQVSIGCTEFDTALKNINDAVKEADDKMYTAKKRARETADPLRTN